MGRPKRRLPCDRQRPRWPAPVPRSSTSPTRPRATPSANPSPSRGMRRRRPGGRRGTTRRRRGTGARWSPSAPRRRPRRTPGRRARGAPRDHRSPPVHEGRGQDGHQQRLDDVVHATRARAQRDQHGVGDGQRGVRAGHPAAGGHGLSVAQPMSTREQSVDIRMTAPASAALDSLFIGSTDPDRLRRWYVDAFGVEPDVDGFLQFGAGGSRRSPAATTSPTDPPSLAAYLLELPRAGHQGRGPAPRRARRHLGRARSSTATPGLWFGTVEDPDGNYVQLIEITPEYWAQKRRALAAWAGPLARRDGRHPSCRPRTSNVLALGTPTSSGSSRPTNATEVSATSVSDTRVHRVRLRTAARPATHTQMGPDVPDLDLAAVEPARHAASSSTATSSTSTATTRRLERLGERATWFHDSEGNLIGISQLTYG